MTQTALVTPLISTSDDLREGMYGDSRSAAIGIVHALLFSIPLDALIGWGIWAAYHALRGGVR